MSNARKSYEAWKKSMTGGTAEKQKSTAQASYDAWKEKKTAVTQKKTAAQESYEAWKAKNPTSKQPSTASRLQNWMTSSENFVSNYNNRYAQGNRHYRSDAQSWLDRITQQSDALQTEADELRSILETEGTQLEGVDIQEILGVFDAEAENRKKILEDAQKDRDYWSQWGSQREYNEYRQLTRKATGHALEGASFYAELAKKAQQQLDEYLASDEYKSAIAAKSVEQMRQNMFSTAPAGERPLVMISTDKEQELRSVVKYYEELAQSAGDYTTMQADLTELSSWSEEEQAALQNYVSQRETEQFQFGLDAGERQYTADLNAAGIIRKYGYDKVRQMAESYSRDQNRKGSQQLQETVTESVQDGGAVGHNIASVAANLVGSITAPLGYAAELGTRTGRYSTLDPNNVGTLPMKYSGTVRGASEEEIKKWAVNTFGEEDAGKIGGEVLATLYSAGMSAVDNLARIVVSGGFGAATEAERAFSEAMTLGLAATGSFGQTVSEMSAKGASPTEAALMGVVNGGLEVLTEKVSLDNLLKTADGGYQKLLQGLRSALIAGGVEVTEEELSFIGSTLMEAAILQEGSSYNQQIAAMVASGMSWEEARQQANIGLIQEAAQTAIQSFLSGGMMSGATSTFSNTMARQQAKQYRDAAAPIALETLEMDNTSKVAAQVMKTVTSGKKVSASQMAKLLQENGAVQTQAEKTAAAEVIAQELKSRGQSENTAFVAEAVRKQTAGEALSGEEMQAIKTSTAAQDLIRDMKKTRGSTSEEDASDGAVAQAVQTEPETAAVSPKETVSANDQQMASKLTGKESLQVTEETTDTEVEGKSFITSSGQVIEPRKVAAIKGSKVTVETADGKVYDAGDVSFASEDEALLWRTTMGLKNITAEGANTIIQASRMKTGSMNSYVQGAAVAYRSGYLGMEIPAEYAQRLTNAQREVIYNAGKKAAGQAVAREQAKVAVAKNETTTKNGRVHFEGDYATLTERQAASLSALETVADALGVQIYVFESQVDAEGKHVGANGWYDPTDGSIHIDLHAGANGEGTMLFTAAHELVHFIKQWSPAKFKVLANFLMTEYGKQGVSVNELVQNQIAKAERDGRKLSQDEAYEEVIADSMETMLADGKVMEKLAKLKQQDKSLWQKMKDFISDLAAKIRKVYEGLKPDSAEGRLVAQMKDAADRLQQLFAEGLTDAAQNFAGAEKNTTDEGGGVKYSYVPGIISGNEISDNINAIAEMESVTSIRGDEFKMGDGRLLTDVTAFFEAIGGTVYNERLGDIYLRKRGVKDDLGHGMSDEKAASFAAIPAVLEHGRVAGFVANKGGKGFDSATVVAPITIENKPYMMGVIVHRSNGENRFYVHDVFAIKEEAAPLITGAHNVGETGGATSTISIIRKILSVKAKDKKTKKKFSGRDSDGNVLSQKQQEYFRDSVIRDANGDLMPMYHGTMHGGFTVFGGRKDYWYFTNDRRYANAFEGKKGNGQFYPSVKEGIEAGHYTPQRYKVYLNVTNPFITDDTDIIEDALYWDRTLASRLREKGYDALMLADMSQVVVLSANQIKNTTNKNPTSDPDIRYSVRNRVDGKAAEVLQKENEQLKTDVAKLKELLKLQKSVTGGKLVKDSSVEAAARVLKKQLNASGDTAELTGLLKDFYGYIASGKELSWEGVKEQARGAAQWLMEHKKQERSEYAQDILSQIHGSRIYLDESQKAEAAYRFGSFNDYRKGLMGSITIANEANQSLDSFWHEMSSLYPDVFDEDTNSGDMPSKLADIIDRLRSSDTSMLEYEYSRELIEQDIIRQIYDSYWNVSTLYTVADVKQREINRLKGEHIQRMNDLRAKNRDRVESLKQQHRQELAKVRQEYRENAEKKQQEIIEKYRESRQKGVESRNKTAMRHKIQKVVKELNQYLLHGTKDRHVPIGLQKAVAAALDAVNMDTVGAEERIAKLQEELAKAKGSDKIREIVQKIERVQAMGDRMDERLNALKMAYDEIQNDDDPLMAGAWDEGLSAHLMTLIVNVGDTPLRDMTMAQLEDVYNVFQIVLATIRNANKAFKAAKSESISELGHRVMKEIQTVGGKKQQSIKGVEGIKSFGWNNLKPVYAFEHIGSDTFTSLFGNVRSGEDVWARDVSEAREYYLERAKKYGYDSWDMEQRYKFQSTSGMDFELTLDQIMSLYAYSKREQAAEHLRRGGIVFDPKTEVVEKTKGGIKVKYDLTEATAYNLSMETLADIIGKLTEQQRSFVDEMQEYLSSTMGDKGNEVSLQMYGIKLFKEKFYFPLRSAPQYMAKAKEQAQGDVKIKNSGFSKETVKKASNPIVLSSFMDVWGSHVNEMSMYHAFVLPMEDFYRVYNFKTATSDTAATESVEMFLQNAYGKGATGYIDQLLKDLNGGARTDPTTGFINKAMGLYKKGAVFASLSVVVQQPSAVARAAALVDVSHFVGPKTDHKKHKELWAELKEYAPVAIIKEMGYFDTNMGKSTRDFIQGKEYGSIGEKMKALVTDSNYRDEVLSKAPALADEIAWCTIWEAVKRETAEKHPGMDVKSEAFLTKAGQRFTEVITKTQVYDSVLSRSGLMRSKDTGMKMATAFMAEPTTSMNMMADALLKGKRGDRRYCRRAIGAVAASQILNSILVSFVYAGRDDDEDETYWEKYIGSLTGEIIESLNPASYIPFIKDITSIVQGYDVERSDMTIISDLWNAWQRLGSSNISAWQKVEGFAGSVAQLFGLPVKNIMRDVRGMYQTVTSFLSGQQTTLAGVGYSIASAFGKEVSDREQLYRAYIDGDKAHLARVAGRYDNEKAVSSAMRAAIKDHFTSGDIDRDTAEKYLQEYCGMGDDDAFWKAEEWAADDADYSKYGEFYEAVKTGTTLKTVIKKYTDNGVDEETLRKQLSDYYKPLYTAMSKSERAGIKGYLRNGLVYCGMDEQDAMEKLNYWDFLADNPGSELTQGAVTKYLEYGKGAGIPVAVYEQYYRERAELQEADSATKAELLKVIDSLDLTKAQKDALYYANGWAESTIWDAPWR